MGASALRRLLSIAATVALGAVSPPPPALRIQVTQNDAPYLRVDNYSSMITYSSMQLTLPTTASIGCV
jgi:hypothetical protein